MRAAAVALALAAAGLAACERKASRSESTPRPSLDSPPAAPAPAPATAPAAAAAPAPPPIDAAAGACELPRATWRWPAVARVVAVGDVHGDRANTMKALRLAGVVDAAGHWSGGETWLVQTGDLLDRGDDEQAIVDDFERLEGEAAKAGGRFIWLNGNHELMNAAGDLRYVTPGGFKDFEDVPGLDRAAFARAPAGVRARLAAFAPGGPYARILAGQNLVAVVGDTAFVHGGILPGKAAGLDDANHAARCWLAGQGPMPTVLSDDHGPLWDRTLASDGLDCAVLDQALAELQVARIVVGHTSQPTGINSACHGRVWRIDVGLAHFYGGPTEVLELTAAGARVLGR